MEDAVGLVSPKQADGLALNEDVDGEGCGGVVRQVGAVISLIILSAVFGEGKTEIGDAVRVMRQVGTDGPGKILSAYWYHIQGHLDTVVLDRAAVDVDRAIACADSGIHGLQDVVGFLMIDVDAEREAVIPHTEVNTGIKLGGSLPLQVGVGNLAGSQSHKIGT